MARTISIGYQEFEDIIKHNLFYIDKTNFIEEWWNSRDRVTLITRPRRFGKTLTMSMLSCFFSTEYAGCGLFHSLKVWENSAFRELQGTYPVISLSFANIKENNYDQARKKICEIIVDIYNKYDFLTDGNLLNEREKQYFNKISSEMDDSEASISLQRLSGYLQKYYKKKVIILLDEYDTPMQEAYVNGYWEELTFFTRSLFNATFKGNPYLERAILTGITRISKESIFSDLNNLKTVTTTSEKYADCFGFTEEEVFSALEEYGLAGQKQQVKAWYDGFTFGNITDIYNPWSIINFLDTKKFRPYWANTSSNTLVGTLLREGTVQVKNSFQTLLEGNAIETEIDEQILYNHLDLDECAIWSLLLAAGYLRVADFKIQQTAYSAWKAVYKLEITNFETKVMFRSMVHGWFSSSASNYNEFIKAFLQDDLKAMNAYMNRITTTVFSFFDSGNRPSEQSEPERFYHGFVLGLCIDLENQYIITSNRESGYGRYDVILEPRKTTEPAIIIEFKVLDPTEENQLTDTVQKALQQIQDKKYDAVLIAKGIPKNQIRKYGFAFRGKEVLIGKEEADNSV